MNLSFHADWPAAARQMTRFWNREPITRPPIYLTIAAPESERVPVPVPESPEQKYFDPEFLIAACEARFTNSICVAEALPTVTQAMMAGWLPAFGAPLYADDATVWFGEIVHDWTDLPDWSTAWDDEGWRRLKAIMARLIEAGRGRFFVGTPPMLTPNDLLSVLCDPCRFLLALSDYQDEVSYSLETMTTAFIGMFDEITAMCATAFEGTHHHYPVWSPDPLVTVQSDISCTLSPAMFDRFVIPELERITAHTGRGIYHLDGPDAVKHLDRVLDLPHLSMLQWVPGAGQPGGFQHWMHIFKRAQEKGKAIFLPCGVGELEVAVREFRPDLTFLYCGQVDSMAQAEEVLGNLENWTKEYWG
ncbi:MAG: hypothetical protein QM473_12355 [Acidobacteriota bacterium]|jgi:hypothetical protein|nr:hypothetical protein [Acidobacteriota bacterium]